MKSELKETTALRAKWYAAHEALHTAMEAEAKKDPWLASLIEELRALGEDASVACGRVWPSSSDAHIQRVERHKQLSRRWQQYVDADPRLRLLCLEAADLQGEFLCHWELLYEKPEAQRDIRELFKR